ncbi:unannotated protein [freshwater metagenome]|uniref:Unannotated protein n=1 Tax=freshwater metagenome TaxID=449393 RepID=A0A6J7GWA5_9ZZZZ|nr:cytochrome C [Actinomycetota bacterium]
MKDAIRRHFTRRTITFGVLGLVGLFALIQAVPYGHAHSNPPVTKALVMDAPTKKVFTSACGDCHSNLTRWPWYTYVAPSSWLAQNDVEGGRSNLNVSEWDKHAQPQIDEIVDVISRGAMPPLKYKVMPNHADARLSDAEKRTLIDGLRKAYAAQPPARVWRGGDGG